MQNNNNEKAGVFPDFFIGGAQKCGTSSFAAWLDQHPDLICSNPKEPNFFSKKEIQLAEKDYSRYFPDTKKEGEIFFEATTSTLSDDVAIDNIAQTVVNNKKFIFLLRDPVERTISAYFHMLKNFSETRSISEIFGNMPESQKDAIDFEKQAVEKAIQKSEIDATKYQEKYDNGLWSHRYLYNSQYSKHIDKFNRKFGVENILVVNLKKIRANPRAEFDKICRFLGVQEFEVLPDVNVVKNKTIIPAYLLVPAIRKNKIALTIFKTLYSLMARGPLLRFFYVSTPEVSEEIKKKIEKILQSEIDYLKSL